MARILIPSPATPHPHFEIEWRAVKWELTLAMYKAFDKKGKNYPQRCDRLEQPFALNACYRLHPDNESPEGYRLKAADVKYYDKVMLDRLANSNLESVAPLLEWHLHKSSDASGFLQYVRDMVAVDSQLLTPFNYLELEIRDRNFEATTIWLEIQKNTLKASTASLIASKPPKKRALSHRGYMLLLILMDVPKQLVGADAGKQAAVLADLVDFNLRKTYDILFAPDKKVEYDPKHPRVVEELYVFCQHQGILATPLGQKIVTLFNELYSKKPKPIGR